MNENAPKRKRYLKKCCINGCDGKLSNGDAATSTYRFPTSTFSWRNAKRQLWIRAVIKHNKCSNDWQPKPYNVICNLHFAGGQKSEHPHHPAYVPTIFPGGKSAKKEEKRVARYKRRLKREEIKPTVTNTTLQSKSKLIRNAKTGPPLTQQPLFIKVEENHFGSQNVECQANLPDEKPLCDIAADYIMCNLRVENDLNCAETQVHLKKTKTSNNQQPIKVEIAPKKIVFSSPSLRPVEFNGISSIKTNNELLEMCGVTFQIFKQLMNAVKTTPEIERIPISKPNKLLIFLMKLKLGLSLSALSILFQTEQSKIVKIIHRTLEDLAVALKPNVFWPNKDEIKNALPESLKDTYANCRAVIDVTDIQLEIPEDLQERLQFYSTYKNGNSFKLFIAYAPNGFVMYKSNCDSNQKSNELVASDCKILDFIEADDVILADKEIPSIKTAIESKKAIFATPPFTENNAETCVHAHVLNCINQIKLFKILSSMPIDLAHKIDDIVQICCSLNNLRFPLKTNF